MTQSKWPLERLYTFFCIGFFCFAVLMNAPGQEPQVRPPNTDKAVEDFKIKVGVEEVRVDAVVVDSKGRQISDLTQDDFEIYQDDQLQKTISSTYIGSRTQPAQKPAPSQESRKIPGTPIPGVSGEEVRRTLVFLVDDLSMSMNDIYYARMSLRKFVENQMQPGDLIAIMQTTGGNAGLQPFSSDKRQLLARISKIKWDPQLNYPASIPQILAIGFNIRALEDMPGRKYLLLLSNQIMLPDGFSRDPIFDKLADEALRAGVVIHTLDMMGLVGDSTMRVENEDSDTGKMQAAMTARKLNKPLPLSRKTGGLFIENSNFYLSGIGNAAEEMKGYYLLTYVPPASTFTPAGAAAYHRMKIKVKRAGAEVHTRDGFYGSPESLKAQDRTQTPLIQAMFSPFRYHDLPLDMAAGYIHDSLKGYLLRAWLHLDGRRLGFVKEKDGGNFISLEAVATASDITGLAQDSGQMQIRFRVNSHDIQWIKNNGLNISLFIPAKKSGPYYVRAAVKDHASGAIGSAYQFIDIPNVKSGGMALSSIFILNREEDASWIQSGTAEESESRASQSQQAAKRSQALRRYLPGESFEYMAMTYNANAKNGLKPDLESQIVLYRNGDEIFRSKPDAVEIKEPYIPGRIPLRGIMKLDHTMPPGDYVLQLQVRERSQKTSAAAQTLNFEVGTNFPEASLGESAPAEAITKTVIEMSEQELRRFYKRELSGVQFDAGHDRLQYLLPQAGKKVEAFFHDLSNTSSKEQVEMSKSYRDRLGAMVPVMDGNTSTDRLVRVEEYQYLVLPGSGNKESAWVEDRTDKNNRAIKATPNFIMSSGHIGMCLYLHPRHQQNSVFRYLGRETKKAGAYVIAFAQKPEAHDYLAQYSELGSSTPIRFLVQGFVWLDPDSYQIQRMRTSMLISEKPTRLKETVTDIYYQKIQFDSPRREFWLPQTIDVTWEFPQPDGIDVIYKNQHKYSDFHFFSVDADYKIDQPKADH
jgi:VWFA-related protein